MNPINLLIVLLAIPVIGFVLWVIICLVCMMYVVVAGFMFG